jgi:peptidyl-prolyl cis-trans isomerase C
MRIQTSRSSAPKIIAVNETVIASADIAREVQNHEGGSPVTAWEAATRALVVRELLSQRAHALDLVPEPRAENGLRETDEEALIRMLLEAEVRTPTAEEADCRRYYQSNLERFRSADLYEPLHILFKAHEDDAAAYGLAVERAEAVLREVKAAPDRFEGLARALSDCPSATEGGRLGQVAAGDTTPEFEKAIRSLVPGQICPDVVRTRYGVHVVRLDRKVEGSVLPFENVRERIASYLEANASRRAAAQYVALLAGQARISLFFSAINKLYRSIISMN